MKKEAIKKIANGHKLIQEGYEELAECFLSTASADLKEKMDTAEKAESQKEDKSSEAEGKTVTMEDVRAVLATKTRDGKTQKVKALLNDFGAEKLSSVPEDKLADLLKKAVIL